MDVLNKVLPDSDTRPDVSHDDGDRERFAHYVQKDKITQSAVTGDPVIALCGKVWCPPATRRSSPCARSARRPTRR